MKHEKQIRVYAPFASNCRRKYPYKSMYQITKELNNILEDLLYENARKKR
jgi:hypothetical protein